VRQFPCLALLVAGVLSVNSRADDAPERVLIEDAKKALVSNIDHRLPKVNLEFFLNYEAEGSPIHWEVNSCGEGDRNASAGTERAFNTCVEADFDLHGRSVEVLVSFGSRANLGGQTPKFLDAIVTEQDGSTYSIKQLGDLPARLHRPTPKEPRDLLRPAEMS
jgi:hypothetical protein